MDIRYLFIVLLPAYYSLAVFPTYYNNEMNFIMDKIFEECLTDKNLPIVLIGNESDTLLKNVQKSPWPRQVSLLGIGMTDNLNDFEKRQTLYKLDNYNEVLKPFPSSTFILNEIKLSELKLSLYKIYHSIWGNLQGHYFMTHTVGFYNCNDAYAFLKVLWDFDILGSTFLCRDSRDGIQLYTFNPFTNYAPHPWEVVQIHEQENGHPFTLFRFIYRNVLDMTLLCHSLHFDKTISLGGFPLKVLATKHPGLTIYDPTQKIFKIRGMEGITAELLWTKLNATLNMTLNMTFSSQREHFYSNGTIYGMIGEVLRGHFDYLLQPRNEKTLWKNQYYTYAQMDMCLVSVKHVLTTQQRIYQTIINKHLITCIAAYLTVTVVFMYLQKNTFIKAALDLLRSIIGVSTLRMPSSSKTRMIFISVIVFFTILNSYIQGTLYSALTVPIYEQIPKSEKGLIDLNYTIYTLRNISNTFINLNLRNRLIIAKNMNVEITTLMEDRSYKSVYMEFCPILRYLVAENSTIRISQVQDTPKEYMVFISRDNFSLYKRFSTIFRYLQESGIQLYHINEQAYFKFTKSNGTVSFESITVKQFVLSMILLIYGLIFSSFVFFVEFMYAYLKHKLC